MKQADQFSKKLEHQAAYYDELFHVADKAEAFRKRGADFELLLSWLGLKEDGRTSEPLASTTQGVPAVVKDYFHYAGDFDLKVISLIYTF